MTECYSHVIYGPTADVIVSVGLPNPLTNVIIPYTGKPKLVIRPVYAEDGFRIKYYEYNLTISATIYQPVAILADIEDEVARIKNILNTPGLKLKLYPVGIGTNPTVNGTVGVHGTDFVPDLTFGPHPIETVVTPVVTNQAIDIEWNVIANISHCSSVYAQNLVQFCTELNIDVDHEGNIAFVQRAVYESATRIPDLSVFNVTMNSFGRQVGTSFQGMTQTHSTHLSMDGRTATFEARYTEIPSDSAFHPFTRNVDLTDELSSDLLGGGFYKWNRKFSAKITLPARVHKAWAWTVFKKILAERLRNLAQLDKVKAKDAIGADNQNADPNAAKNWYLCIKMKITNPVYTRTMMFDFEYLTCTSLDKLLSKTLICSRVNSGFRPNAITGEPEETSEPVTLSDQWLVWDSAFEATLTGDARYKTSIPISYMQCATSAIPVIPEAPTIRAQALLPLESDKDLSPAVLPETTPGNASAGQSIAQNEPLSTVDPNYGWVDYKNSFVLLQENDNLQATYLQATPNSYYRNPSPAYGPPRGAVGFRIDNSESPTDGGYTQPETVSRGISTMQVRMKGYAIRAGSPISVPVLTSIGGSTVERSGKAMMTTQQIAQSSTTPVYLTMWNILYNVNNDIHNADINGTIRTTGQPGYYA